MRRGPWASPNWVKATVCVGNLTFCERAPARGLHLQPHDPAAVPAQAGLQAFNKLYRYTSSVAKQRSYRHLVCYTQAQPSMPSRVTSACSRSSDHPSVPSGRRGTTR